MENFFKGRYGYKEEYKTLEELKNFKLQETELDN